MSKILLPLLVLMLSTSCSNNEGNKKESENINLNTSNMKTIELTKADFISKVANYETSPTEWKYLGDKPALIDFYASWCGPCKVIAPILEELAREYGDSIHIYKINTENEEELASVFGIRSIPSLLFVPMGEQPQMAQGAMSKSDLKKAIDNVLLKK
ncbi:MAG: thioredoxin [Bacteroidales bacterium]